MNQVSFGVFLKEKGLTRSVNKTAYYRELSRNILLHFTVVHRLLLSSCSPRSI